MIFDNARGWLILESNANFADPIEYDMSGISLVAYGHDFKTFRVSGARRLAGGRGWSARGRSTQPRSTALALQISLDGEILQMLKREGREQANLQTCPANALGEAKDAKADLVRL